MRLLSALLFGTLIWVGAAGSTDDEVGQTSATSAQSNWDVFVTTEWLASNLNSPSLRVVDARSPYSTTGYSDGHIPGAAYVDIWYGFSDPNNPVPLEILPPGPFADLMGSLGIDNHAMVIVYDTD